MARGGGQLFSNFITIWETPVAKERFKRDSAKTGSSALLSLTTIML